ARHFADILAEIADRHAGIDRHLAVVGPILACDHPEKRRLAGAVRANKSHLLPLLDAHRSVDEQDLLAVLLADVIETNHEVRAGWKRLKRRWNGSCKARQITAKTTACPYSHSIVPGGFDVTS